MQTIELVNLDSIQEARRQIEICNACRYCESYCSVFPAVHSKRAFSDGDLVQLANLCHNCRGCYYACQYTAPHEFAMNVPAALARVRQESWQENAVPRRLARAFHHSGVAISLAVIAGLMSILLLMSGAGDSEQPGFYGLMSHNLMALLFVPAFLLPLLAIGWSVRRYWKRIGGQRLTLAHLRGALSRAGRMKDLSGGHGDGCNFEQEDRFSNARRWCHQMTMYGFLLCFAATSVATLMHYLFDLPAPYDLKSLPKLLGVPGGLLLSAGTLGLALLKLRADRTLADARVWGGEMAFVVLVFLVSSSGLLLYLLGSTPALAPLLAFHLGAVLAFFLLMPYSKMVHGFYRLAALLRDEQTRAS